MTELAELIRHDPPLRYGSVAYYPFKFAMEKAYRFETRYGEEVLLHKKVGHEIQLPRALCPVGPNDLRSRGEAVELTFHGDPRDEQKDVFAQTVQFLHEGLSGIVEAYTGWGKTVLGVYAAASLGRKTLIITTKSDIFDQWIDACHKFLWLDPRSEVGVIKGNTIRVDGYSIVIAMVQTLAKGDKLSWQQMSDFGFVIFDEVHRFPAETFSQTVDLLPSFWRLGLSADSTRADGKDLLIQAHIGPVRAKTIKQERIPKILVYTSPWRCPREIAKNPDGSLKLNRDGEVMKVRIPHEPARTAHIEELLSKDDARNDILGDIMHMVWSAKRKTAVFSTQLQHLNTLRKVAMDKGIPAKDIGFYVGATTKEEKLMQEQAKVKPIMLTTFKMMGEGTNIPWLDCGILAIPMSNVNQACGRIRREYVGKKDPPVWIDLQDLDSPVFSAYASNRLKWYKSLGCVIKVMS